MMGPSRRQLAAAFRHALATSDAAALDSAATELEFYRLAGGAFPEDDFDLVIKTIRRPEFASMRGGWTLLTLFDRHRDALSPQQEGCLLKALNEIYPHLREDNAFFIVCELLGRCFHNEPAFRLLEAFARLRGEMERLYIPDALEHLIRATVGTQLARRAAALLLTMGEDPSPHVRREAREASRALCAEGIDLAAMVESEQPPASAR